MIIRTSSFLTSFILLVTMCVVSEACAQESPLFPGEEHLERCTVDLPFTVSKKVKPKEIEAARALEEQELVYLTYDKKSGKSLGTRVYVMIDTNEDGAESMYLETSEEHRRTDGLKQSYLPNFKANTERFYDAQCFNLALIEHPELKEEVVMAVAEKPHK